MLCTLTAEHFRRCATPSMHAHSGSRRWASGSLASLTLARTLSASLSVAAISNQNMNRILALVPALITQSSVVTGDEVPDRVCHAKAENIDGAGDGDAAAAGEGVKAKSVQLETPAAPDTLAQGA